MQTPPKSGRPVCPNCSKPTRFCLCTRLKNPKLQNSVAVTVLQHSLEKKHPLNSTRIASLALKNLSAISVSDVNSQAQFLIRLFSSNLEKGVENSDEIDGKCRDIALCGSDGKAEIFNEEFDVVLTIEKYGEIRSFQDCWRVENGVKRCNLDQLLCCREAVDDLRNGFVVKKTQKTECEESEEFEIAVPAGSVLLFPSENSVGVEAIDFEVKNVIVLDGTWAKAKRMYKENPWLKLLPHVKLDIGSVSLYGEVRHQPKAGFLSTIESIVYALKALGDDLEGLDDLLDVFASMVGDQRRCKDERLSKTMQD